MSVSKVSEGEVIMKYFFFCYETLFLYEPSSRKVGTHRVSLSRYRRDNTYAHVCFIRVSSMCFSYVFSLCVFLMFFSYVVFLFCFLWCFLIYDCRCICMMCVDMCFAIHFFLCVYPNVVVICVVPICCFPCFVMV